MAWTALSFAYGSKLTSTKMTQMVDNFTAMGSGSAGAPRVARLALEPYTAGSYAIFTGGAGATQSNTWAKLVEIVVPRGGAMTVCYRLDSVSTSASLVANVFRGGAAVGTQRALACTSGGVGSAYIESISSWTAGDLLQVWGYGVSSAYTGITSLCLRVANPIVPINTAL